jgi:hypothetical protein
MQELQWRVRFSIFRFFESKIWFKSTKLQYGDQFSNQQGKNKRKKEKEKKEELQALGKQAFACNEQLGVTISPPRMRVIHP